MQNLKSLAIQRISLDMIETTKMKDNSSPFIILVVDDYTAGILSFYMSMSEVLNKGIFSIERLSIKRKPYPNYVVIYFVSPTKESCEHIVKDFEDGNPQYGNVHIFFSSRLLDTNLSILAKEHLAYKVKSIKELNISFFSKDNYFDLRNFSLQLFALNGNNYVSQRRLVLNSIKDKMMTVLTSLKEFPFIQYQESSFSSELAMLLHSSLDELNDKELLKKDRKCICLIVDRSIDIFTPLIHDYSYKALVYDFFSVDNEGYLNSQADGIENYKLDEKDYIWSKYKNNHIGEVLKSIQEDVQEFNSSDLKRKEANLDNFDEMIKSVEGIKDHQSRQKQLNMHLKLCNKILKVCFLPRFFLVTIYMILLSLNKK